MRQTGVEEIGLGSGGYDRPRLQFDSQGEVVAGKSSASVQSRRAGGCAGRALR
jgi:hypothetical protein